MSRVKTFFVTQGAIPDSQALEAARRAGFRVFLLEEDGKVHLTGFPSPYEGLTTMGQPVSLPWRDTNYLYYTNVWDALAGSDAYGFDAVTEAVYRPKERQSGD